MERSLINRLLGKRGSEVKPQETLPVVQPNRIVVFGSHNSGAGFLAHGFEDYLRSQGIENPYVHYVRNTTNINAGFLNYWPENPLNDYWPDPTADSDQPTLPRGVILMPEMRQYHEMTGMFVPTYQSGVASYVRELCERYNVPLIEIHGSLTPEQIKEQIIALIPASQ